MRREAKFGSGRQNLRFCCARRKIWSFLFKTKELMGISGSNGDAIMTLRLLFFFFHWHYSPLWVLACRTRSFHFSHPSPTLSIIVKSIPLFPLFDFRNNNFFTVWGC
jgi:hypothetical protein